MQRLLNANFLVLFALSATASAECYWETSYSCDSVFVPVRCSDTDCDWTLLQGYWCPGGQERFVIDNEVPVVMDTDECDPFGRTQYTDAETATHCVIVTLCETEYMCRSEDNYKCYDSERPPSIGGSQYLLGDVGSGGYCAQDNPGCGDPWPYDW